MYINVHCTHTEPSFVGVRGTCVTPYNTQIQEGGWGQVYRVWGVWGGVNWVNWVGGGGRGIGIKLKVSGTGCHGAFTHISMSPFHQFCHKLKCSTSVPDPWHFGTDPDPAFALDHAHFVSDFDDGRIRIQIRIRTSDKQTRIQERPKSLRIRNTLFNTNWNPNIIFLHQKTM